MRKNFNTLLLLFALTSMGISMYAIQVSLTAKVSCEQQDKSR